MKKIRAGAGDEVPLIDQCPLGQGLWFDQGELSEVIRRGSLDPEHKIVKLLTEMFAAEKLPAEKSGAGNNTPAAGKAGKTEPPSDRPQTPRTPKT